MIFTEACLALSQTTLRIQAEVTLRLDASFFDHFNQFNQSPESGVQWGLGNMTKANEEKTPPASEKNATVKTIIKLFWDSRKGGKDFAVAQKVEQEIAGLAAQVAAAEPNTAAHADALEYHYYMLRWLAKLRKSNLDGMQRAFKKMSLASFFAFSSTKCDTIFDFDY